MITIKKLSFFALLLILLLIMPVLALTDTYTMGTPTGGYESSFSTNGFRAWDLMQINHTRTLTLSGVGYAYNSMNLTGSYFGEIHESNTYYGDVGLIGHAVFEWSCDYANDINSPCAYNIIFVDVDDSKVQDLINSLGNMPPWDDLFYINDSPTSGYIPPYSTQGVYPPEIEYPNVTYPYRMVVCGWGAMQTGGNYFIEYYPNSLIPKVDFSYTNLGNPLVVTFTDTSINFNPVYFGWWFGDGDSHIGVESTIQHVYTALGTYEIDHAATDLNGISGWENKTITISSSQNGGYVVSVNPSTVIYGNPTTVSLSGDLNKVNVVSYYTQDSVNFESFTLFKSYRKNDDLTWSRINVSGEPYIVTSDNPFSFSYSPPTYGNKTISAYVYNKTGVYPTQYLALVGSPSTILHVISPAINPLVNMYLYAYDVYTGAHLSNVTLTLTDYTLGGYSRTWNNIQYELNVVMNAYDYANLSASKEGYYDGYMTFSVPLATGNKDNPQNPPQMNQFVGVPLIPSYIPSNANNGTLIVTALDSITNQPIPNFKISISPINVLRTADNLGTQLIILIPYNTALYATCSATGYQSQSVFTGIYQPSVMKKEEFKLVKIAATPTPTHTTPVFTTQPTAYETGGGTVINGTTFCQYPHDLRGSIDYFLCTSGVTNSDARDLIIAMFLILAIGLGVAYITKDGMGFVAGAIIGFVFALGFGLIPLWILFVIIAVGVMIGIVLIWRGH